MTEAKPRNEAEKALYGKILGKLLMLKSPAFRRYVSDIDVADNYLAMYDQINQLITSGNKPQSKFDWKEYQR